MFNNIGGKIKTLVKIFCWLGIALSILIGMAVMALDEIFIIIGLAIVIIGSIFSWVTSFLVYGFGELIAKVTEINFYISKSATGANSEDIKKEFQSNFETESIMDIPKRRANNDL